jgi:ribokinase
MITFGPVPSRRLGQSLGITNIPPKVCTYSCIYCQVGRTSKMQVDRQVFYEPRDIFCAAQDKVGKVREAGETVDSGGDGGRGAGWPLSGLASDADATCGSTQVRVGSERKRDMPPRLTVVGSLNMDLVVRSPRIPRPGETIIGSAFHVVPGGKGANQAVAAARLGAQVAMVGRLGDDDFGHTMLDSLVAEGVDVTFVTPEPKHPTGVALITVDDTGENTIVVASGANMNLSPVQVEAAMAAIEAADVLLLQLEIPLESVIRAAELARSHGTKVILNPAPARPVPNELLALVDVLVPNESETELLAGISFDDPVGAGRAAQKLLERGVETVVLTLGAHGALLAYGDQIQHVPAFEVEPVDTTAAGDAFLAGFAVALAEGKPLSQAVSWGNAAGALATTKLGAQPSLPTRPALEELLPRV